MIFKKNKSGYKYFKEGNKIVFVHKRVAEKKVGGKILKGYQVHHKDGNKENNRPSNLAVLKTSFHRKIHSKKNSFETKPIPHKHLNTSFSYRLMPVTRVPNGAHDKFKQ